MAQDGGRPAEPSPRDVRAAQLRARVHRWGLIRCGFGLLFAIGASAHVMGPVPVVRSSVLWASILVVLSGFHVGIGLRALGRVHGWSANLWQVATLGWGGAVTAVVAYLLRRSG